MGCLGTTVTLPVGAGRGDLCQGRPGCAGGGCGLASQSHRRLLPAGVAADEQGLRFPLTLSETALRRDCWAGSGA